MRKSILSELNVNSENNLLNIGILEDISLEDDKVIISLFYKDGHRELPKHIDSKVDVSFTFEEIRKYPEYFSYPRKIIEGNFLQDDKIDSLSFNGEKTLVFGLNFKVYDLAFFSGLHISIEDFESIVNYIDNM